jgi:hypothetical protein
MDELRENLNRETGVISWAELIRHFARGVVIKVDPNIDLIDVAQKIASDNATELQVMLNEGTVAKASDDDARDWTRRNPDFWCVVTAPWVLVQEKTTPDKIH